MRKFKLTNPNFKGHVMFGYDMDGYLQSYSNDSEMNKAQVYHVLCRFPLSIDQLHKAFEGSAAVIEELPPDLTFDAFWAVQAKRKKVNRKRCEEFWDDKMTDANKMLAITRYPGYLKFCETNNRYIADPENYLKKEYYLTDHTSLK
jgi:hypothetical protein